MFKRPDTILFIIFASAIYFLEYLQRDSTFFIYGLAELFFGFFFMVVLTYSLVKNLGDRSKQSLLKRFQPFLFGLLLAFSFPLLHYLLETDGGKKIKLEANAGGDLTSVQLDLHEDGTFKLYNGGPFGGNYHRGNYQLGNDTLRLDNGDKDLYPTLTFVLRNDTALNKQYFDPTGTKNSYYKLYIQDKKPAR